MSLDFNIIDEVGEELHWQNITHNLNKMANEAGIYEILWHPVENGYVYCKDITPKLIEGYNKMLDNPEYYRTFDSPNGWGTYDTFIEWIFELLEKLQEYPDAKIETYT